MKKSLLMLLVLALVSFSSQAQSETKKKVSFKVYGNCGMCKSKIEAAVTGKAGIYAASWDTKSKKMTVTYNPKKTDLSKIKQKIADVGYDSESHRAKKATYDNLHGCCQYERPKN